MYEDLPNFWISVVLFLAVTIGAHVWLIWLRPASEVFWKKVDYLWVGLAAFAIIAAISQVRTIVAVGVLSQTTAGWHTRTATVVQNAKMMRDVLCRDRSTSEKVGGCAWYDQAIKEMEKADKSADSWSKLSLRPIDTLRDDFKQEARLTISNLDWVKDEAKRRLDLEAAAKKEEGIATIPLAASLFLLPIAFGIRLTKVTAEVRLAKANAKARAVATA
jgi:hypothetical protein